jgi:flagellar L-ring protein FlgH
MKEPLLSHFEARPPRQRCRALTRAALVAGVALCSAVTLPADSLWHDEVSKPMSADKRATRVGDIVTILVQENTTATKDNSTKTSKQSSIDAAISSFLYSPAASGLLTKGGTLPAVKLAGKSDFSGGGSINNSQQIIASVAVRVTDVLPNGNLIIEGTRESAFSGEQQTIILRGTIRQEDIMANNTVLSYNVADATIKFISKGTITDSQRKGWFHRLWDKLSPF